jgi:hypothetical protein
MEVLPERDKDVLVRVDVGVAEELLERLSRLPSVVMRDLGRDVVRDVGLGDAVLEVRADEAKDVAVDGGERAAGESPSASGVVGDKRVGVLKERDEDELKKSKRGGQLTSLMELVEQRPLTHWLTHM